MCVRTPPRFKPKKKNKIPVSVCVRERELIFIPCFTCSDMYSTHLQGEEGMPNTHTQMCVLEHAGTDPSFMLNQADSTWCLPPPLLLLSLLHLLLLPSATSGTAGRWPRSSGSLVVKLSERCGRSGGARESSDSAALEFLFLFFLFVGTCVFSCVRSSGCTLEALKR